MLTAIKYVFMFYCELLADIPPDFNCPSSLHLLLSQEVVKL